jgi:coproporphyrinogen III oxidase
MRDLTPEFEGILDLLVTGLGKTDGRAFHRDRWEKPRGGVLEGSGVTCIIEQGALFERGGVALSNVRGRALPPSATQRNPHLAGKPFRALGVSLVLHPTNPHVPTSHLNVRSFQTDDGAHWWFGGGFDLTPYFYEPDDEQHWHAVCRDTCAPFGGAPMYERMAADCDAYFTLKHRQERRGLGGIFFDDLNTTHDFGGSFDTCFDFVRSVARGFLAAYVPLVEKRRHQPFTEQDRAWQAFRRGRYVEFNLVWDRGTLFGLQSGGRTESILMSMPPHATWQYGDPPFLEARHRRLMERIRVNSTASASE